MAKQALLDVLEKTVGKYVKNLDSESLNVAVWSGEIVLSNLELNVPNVNAELAQSALGVPIRAVHGHLGNLSVQVPWAHLLSQPVVLKASELQVVVEPHAAQSTSNYNANHWENLLQERLQNMQLSDLYRQQANSLQQELSNKGGTDNTFGTRLVRRIVENLQMEFSHIRVVVQNGGNMGVFLRSLAIFTTDANGNRTFVDRTNSTQETSFLHKQLVIDDLGVYVDHKDAGAGSLRSIGEDDDNDDDSEFHHWILSPLSFQTKLVQSDSTTCVDFFKYTLEGHILNQKGVQLRLARWQLEQIHNILYTLQSYTTTIQPLFPEYRPLQSISKETVLLWWKYALRCVGRLNGKRGWVEFLRAFRRRKQYLELYKKHVYAKDCKWITPLSDNDKLQLQEIENDRSISVEGIMAWRNIVDRQVQKETEKHQASKKQSSGAFLGLFGSSSTVSSQTNESVEAPITLTIEELQELESLTVQQSQEAALSSDSKLCYIQFVLSQLRIDLSSVDQRPLATLIMGAVSTTFQANQDGSYLFDAALTSLQVEDRNTPKTLFPHVLQNQADSEKDDEAFKVHLSKTMAGDQRLQVKLNTFEIVAAQTLVVEMHRFFALDSKAQQPKYARANPLLAQSLSGSVDLFYDATEGNDSSHSQGEAIVVPNAMEEPQPSVAVEDLSLKLIDAWRNKTREKTAWEIDLDIRAPIIVVPERCSDPRANVIVFDMGHLRLQYGLDQTSANVKGWFHSNPRKNAPSSFDNGTLQITSLTFSIGRASYWRRLVQKTESVDHNHQLEDAVVEPISLAVDFSLEISASDTVPRCCVIGDLPSISMRLSPGKFSRMLKVITTWMGSVGPILSSDDEAESLRDTESRSIASGSFALSPRRARRHQPDAVAGSKETEEDVVATLHADLRLRRLSVEILGQGDSGIEAHLVSVSSSFGSYSDGSSKVNVSMGWFWFLDRCRSDVPRTQRLFAHSTLPLSADEFATQYNYDVLGELERRGVFNNNFGRSAELADVSLIRAGPQSLKAPDPFSVDDDLRKSCPASLRIQARLSRLFINWNPMAVVTMTSITSAYTKLLEEISKDDEDGLILTSPEQLRRRPRSASFDSLRSRTKTPPAQETTTVINATMDGIRLALHSARDDLPLFVGTMAATDLFVVARGDNLLLDIKLDDFQLASPEMGRTDSIYRTILGLASSKSESLLDVRFCSGPKAVAACGLDNVDPASFEALAEITLSPMRIVYIQAQVLALVEYATAGILGSLTAQAASSAAQAAVELAATTDLKKLFRVKATNTELLLPQAAYKPIHLSACVGGLSVDFLSMPDSSSKAAVLMHNVLIRDAVSENLLQDPVRMKIDALIPPDGVGTKHDQAIRVDIDFSQAHFMLAKSSYEQILRTLDENFGEIDLFLRDGSESVAVADEEESIQQPINEDGALTHAGAIFVDNPRQIHLNVKVAALLLSLFGLDQFDPIVRLEAVDSEIEMRMLSDEQKMTVQVTLRDLLCNDERVSSLNRQYRSLIYQPFEAAGEGESDHRVFAIHYENNGESGSTVEVTVGSPRLVFIPDAVSDILSFLSVERAVDETALAVTSTKSVSTPEKNYREVVHVDSAGGDSGVEAAVVSRVDIPTTSLDVVVKTSLCTVSLVDLGSNDLLMGSSSKASVSSVSETIVLGGVFDVKMTIESEQITGNMTELSTEIHANAIEMYTAFGLELQSAVQILDPTDLSFYFNQEISGDGNTKVDVRCAVVSPLDISLSMCNIALINAISASITDSFTNAEDSDTEFLSNEESKRIERLARALESDDELSTSTHSRATGTGSYAKEDSVALFSEKQSQTVSSREVSMKITTPDMELTLINDLQGLDEAIVRVTVRNFIANGSLQENARGYKLETPYTAFDLNVHTTVLADYFDSSTNLWKVLLRHPWEISTKAQRGVSPKLSLLRPSTTVDIESLPCHLSFSEQFLMSLASANRMWAVYDAASTSALESLKETTKVSFSLKKSVAAGAARSLIASLPYAVENHAGVRIGFEVEGEGENRRYCESGSIVDFRFEPPPGRGSGGRRSYGQDDQASKSVSVFVDGHRIEIKDIDSHTGRSFDCHRLDDGVVLVTDVVKSGKNTVLHISSGIDVQNHSTVPFTLSVYEGSTLHEVATCTGTGEGHRPRQSHALKSPMRFGIPITLMADFRKSWSKTNESQISIAVSPNIDCGYEDWFLRGSMRIHIKKSAFVASGTSTFTNRFDVQCRPVNRKGAPQDQAPRDLFAFIVQVSVKSILIDDSEPYIEVTMEPRATITNHIPIPIHLKTPMPHIFGCPAAPNASSDAPAYLLESSAELEVFTAGQSISVSFELADNPVGGTSTSWMDCQWVDLPLISEFRMTEPLECRFPFVQRSLNHVRPGSVFGSEFFVFAGEHCAAGPLVDKSSQNSGVEVSAASDIGDWRHFSVAVNNYAVDHTGDVLFEELPHSNPVGTSNRRSLKGTERRRSSKGTGPIVTAGGCPIGAYSTKQHRGRISLLPQSETLVRLLHLTMEGTEGVRRSVPFNVAGIALCDGGMDSSSIFWEDNTPSGFFAYRQLIGAFQFAVHVVPEYVIFNGSKKRRALVHQPGGITFAIEPGRIAPLRPAAGETVSITIEFPDMGGQTRSPVRIDKLGLRMAVVVSSDGKAMGSLAVQTVVGSRDSRLVAKIGDVKFSTQRIPGETPGHFHILKDDFLRFRIRWSELQLTLKEARPITEEEQAFFETALDNLKQTSIRSGFAEQGKQRGFFSPGKKTPKTWIEARELRRKRGLDSLNEDIGGSVCTIWFHRFTIDWQRVFKETCSPSKEAEKKTSTHGQESPSRSQFSVVVHNVRIKDETPDSPYPIVFDSTTQHVSFFELTIRLRGDVVSEIVQVDILNINLAHGPNGAENIYVTTSEDFVWSLLDLADRIVAAAAEFAGMDVKLTWNEEHDGYVVSIREKTTYIEDETKYVPPRSDTIYNIKKTRVSPFKLIVSFKRSPQVSRYGLSVGVRGANIMNYFTRQLKFKIEKAELTFRLYEVNDVKGPPDQIIELLLAVYTKRMTKKIATIMQATSFQDWKRLAHRDTGDDDYLEGDFLRAGGNMAGRGVNYLLKRTGSGIGGGVHTVASGIGDGIENATKAIGVGALGAGVNSVVSGLGAGVGDTISGVGTGAGKIVKGAGQGVGQVVGGVAGGVVMVGKGIGKGVTTGDHKAVSSGFVEGVSSMGTGTAKGVESIVVGTAEGVMSVGKGLFSGVKNVGQGIGGALTGKKHTPKRRTSSKKKPPGPN